MTRPIIGAGLELDLQRLLVTRLLIQANSGGGKSYTLRRLLEQTFGLVPQVVIDLEDEFHTLREKYPYVLAGAAGADCRADPRTAHLLARRILEHGFSVIVSIAELKHHERILFVRRFLEALVDSPRALWRPLLVVVDEAHMFCPEGAKAESATAVTDLMTRGRKRGFCGVLATQRISKLNKDAAAEANNKLIGRTSLDVDMKRAADELGFRTLDQQHSLRELDDGEFFAFGPALTKSVVKVKVGSVKTTHPEPGSRSAPPPPAPDKLRAILAKLADLPADAAAEEGELERLRREVSDLRRKATAPASDQGAIGRARADGWTAGQQDGFKTGYRAAQHHAMDIQKAVEGVAVELRKLSLAPAPKPPAAEPPPTALRTVRSRSDSQSPQAAAVSTPRAARPPASGDPRVPRPQQALLEALAWLEAAGMGRASRVRVALLAGTTPSSSGFQNNLGALRTAGLISYPSGGELELTEEGRAVAPPPAGRPTSQDLHRTLEAKLSRPLWQILRALIEVYPRPLRREDLAGALQPPSTASSSGFQNNLGALRSLGFLDYPRGGEVVALPALFLEE